jgi:hypothetical protein
MWEDPNAAIKPNPGQTELLFWGATTEEIVKWEGFAKDKFPGGWKGIGKHLSEGLKFYRWKFVKPGKTIGMAFDGLVYVNGHWVFVPKPYRFLGS